MRIKICISNYGTSQLDHLYTIIEEFKNYEKYEVDIKVFTTVPVNENHILYPESITSSLPYMCREEIVNDINNYDIFIFTENDHLITEDNIDCFLEISKNLNPNQVCGFIQYEEIYGAKVLVHNPYYGDLINKKYENLFTCNNNHQGCWILLRKDLIEVVKSGNFLVSPHHGPYGIIEQGASDPYTSCGMEKVFPLDLQLLKRLMVKHLPIKYCLKEEFIKHAIKIDQFYMDAVSHNIHEGIKKISRNGIDFLVNSNTQNSDFWNIQDWEKENYTLLKKESNRHNVFVHAGGWIGPFTLYCSKLYDTVYCLEPDPVAYDELKNNIKINGSSNIILENKAFYKENTDIYIGCNTYSLGKSTTNIFDKDNNIEVNTTTLFDFFTKYNIPEYSFLMLDVEGAEYCLFDDYNFYEKFKPTVLISLHLTFLNDENFDILIESLTKLKHIYEIEIDSILEERKNLKHGNPFKEINYLMRYKK